jgi:hypothetical protein
VAKQITHHRTPITDSPPSLTPSALAGKAPSAGAGPAPSKVLALAAMSSAAQQMTCVDVESLNQFLLLTGGHALPNAQLPHIFNALARLRTAEGGFGSFRHLSSCVQDHCNGPIVRDLYANTDLYAGMQTVLVTIERLCDWAGGVIEHQSMRASNGSTRTDTPPTAGTMLGRQRMVDHLAEEGLDLGSTPHYDMLVSAWGGGGCWGHGGVPHHARTRKHTQAHAHTHAHAHAPRSHAHARSPTRTWWGASSRASRAG